MGMAEDLRGCRVLVTRPAHQAPPTLAAIRERGGEPLAFPTLEIAPPTDARPGRAVAGELTAFDWLVFASTNAVDGFARFLASEGREWPAGPRYAAIGAPTARALEQQGVAAVTTPPDYRSEGFLALPAMAAEAVAGQRFLLVRGEGGRELLPTTLEERGAEVVRLPVYRRRCPDADPAPVSAALASGGLDAALLTSPEAFTNLLTLLGEADRRRLAAILLVVISPVTAHAVTEAGYPEPVVAGEASSEGLLNALAEHCPPPREHEEYAP